MISTQGMGAVCGLSVALGYCQTQPESETTQSMHQCMSSTSSLVRAYNRIAFGLVTESIKQLYTSVLNLGWVPFGKLSCLRRGSFNIVVVVPCQL